MVKYLQAAIQGDDSKEAQKWAEQFMSVKTCPECHGGRLNKESLSYRIYDKNISQVAELDIRQLYQWLDEAEAHLDHKTGR